MYQADTARRVVRQPHLLARRGATVRARHLMQTPTVRLYAVQECGAATSKSK